MPLVTGCAADAPQDANGSSWSAEDVGCLSCHAETGRELRSSGHGGRPGANVGCLGCHLPHASEGPGGELGPSGLRAGCADCHPDVAGQFLLPYTHRPGTGVGCLSCHEPHASSRRGVHAHERRDACLACHLEYRGPFTYPHEGDHNLGCISCHMPHGSGNRRILTYPDSFSLCLSCHPLVEHDVTQPIWRGCLNCHTEVHGSRWDRELFR